MQELMTPKEYSKKAKIPYSLLLEATRYCLKPAAKIGNGRLFYQEDLATLVENLKKLKGGGGNVKEETANSG